MTEKINTMEVRSPMFRTETSRNRTCRNDCPEPKEVAIVAGVDNGLKGHMFARLASGEFFSERVFKPKKIRKNSLGMKEPDIIPVVDLMNRAAGSGITGIMIENPLLGFSMSRSTEGLIGPILCYRTITAAAEIAGLSVTGISAREWQRRVFSLHGFESPEQTTKERSLELAEILFPGIKLVTKGCRVKNDNISDSALIHWFAMNLVATRNFLVKKIRKKTQAKASSEQMKLFISMVQSPGKKYHKKNHNK